MLYYVIINVIQRIDERLETIKKCSINKILLDEQNWVKSYMAMKREGCMQAGRKIFQNVEFGL